MNTTSAPRTSETPRPLLFRVASKWYSWAGLVLTLTGAYLAFDGQLRFGSSQLQAAPPGDISWEPQPGASRYQGPQLPSSGPSAAPSQGTGPILPPPPSGVDPTRPQLNPKVSSVLSSYVAGPDVVPTNYSEPGGVEAVPPKPPAPDLIQLPLPSAEQGPAAEAPAVIQDTPPSPAAPPFSAPLPRPEMPALVRPGGGTPVFPAAQGFLIQGKPQAPGLLTAQPQQIPSQPTPAPGVAIPRPSDAAGIPRAEIKDQPPVSAISPSEEEKLSREQRDLLELGRLAEKNRDYQKAARNYTELLVQQPGLLGVRAQLAGLLVTAGDIRHAAEQYQEAVRRAPANPVLRARLGDVYVILKEYGQAILQYTEALRLNPTEPEYAVRLARAYAFDNDTQRATQVYEQFLAPIRPEDPRAPLAMGALLLDLERANEALAYLIIKRKQLERDVKPRDSLLLEVLANLARAYARIGDRTSALEILNEMAGRAPDQTSVRLTLGDTFVGNEEFELAAQAYNQVLTVDPNNGAALIGLARVFVDMYQPANARKILDSITPRSATDQRNYLFAYASYHTLIGEYTEAKLIYLDMLRRNESDHDVRYTLGKLYDNIREWEKAKAEFAKIQPRGSLGRRARLAFALVLNHQRKFLEAAEIAQVLLNEDPSDSAAVAEVARHLGKACKYDQAFAVCRAYLANYTKSEFSGLGVRLALARTLLDAGRYTEAAKEYEIVLSRPAGRVVTAYYGLARAAEKLGNAERARQLLGCVGDLVGGPLRNQILLADEFSSDNDDSRVLEILGRLQASDPENLAILIRIADAQQRQGRFTGNPQDAFATTDMILRLSPNNVRGYLARARSFAVTQNYRKAAAQYDSLILMDPEYTIPPRERARVLYSDHQYSASRSQYTAMMMMSPDDFIMAEMAGHIQREPKVRGALNPILNNHLGANALHGELSRLAGVSDEETRQAAQRLMANYDATVAWQHTFQLERDAKELKDLRNYQAIPVYQAAIANEPTNTEARQDLGQIYGSLMMTNKAIQEYSGVLEVDPTNRDAAACLERANANLAPRWDNTYSFFWQNGRNGLESIERQLWTSSVTLPFGDEDEYFQAGYSRARYRPFNGDPALDGNIAFFRGQDKFWSNHLLLYGQVNVEDFEDRIHTRPTFDAGFRYTNDNGLTLRGGAYLENQPENGAAMDQDIYRYGVYDGFDYQVSRTWIFGGTYKYGHYSDDNDYNQLFLYNNVALTLPPNELKLVQELFYEGYRQQSVFPINPPNDLNIDGTIHPYFAPKSYAQFEFRVEWWQWLSRDYAADTNQCYYSLQAGLATDNSLNTYSDFRFLLNYDVTNWLTIGSQAQAFVGAQYKMYSALATLQIRFP